MEKQNSIFVIILAVGVASVGMTPFLNSAHGTTLGNHDNILESIVRDCLSDKSLEDVLEDGCNASQKFMIISPISKTNDYEIGWQYVEWSMAPVINEEAEPVETETEETETEETKPVETETEETETVETKPVETETEETETVETKPVETETEPTLPATNGTSST